MVPWLGSPLFFWLLHRSRRRAEARRSSASRFSPRARRAIELKRRAGFVYGSCGLLGIGLYIFGQPPRFWVLPAVVAAGALIFGLIQENLIANEEG